MPSPPPGSPTLLSEDAPGPLVETLLREQDRPLALVPDVSTGPAVPDGVALRPDEPAALASYPATDGQEPASLVRGAAGYRRVLLVCSSGGHLSQLYRLKPWWEQRERMWVAFDKEDAHSLLTGERVAWAYHPTTRNIRNAARNLLLARRVLSEFRPQVVISDGAGVAFPFFVAARVLRIRTVYIEVYDRIDAPTLTGRLCYPLSDLFLLQWEEQRRMYPRGVVIGGLL